MSTDDLLTPNEVADALGLDRREAVRTYRSRYDDFPEPALEKDRCSLWLRQDIEAWKATRAT